MSIPFQNQNVGASASGTSPLERSFPQMQQQCCYTPYAKSSFHGRASDNDVLEFLKTVLVLLEGQTADITLLTQLVGQFFQSRRGHLDRRGDLLRFIKHFPERFEIARYKTMSGDRVREFQDFWVTLREPCGLEMQRKQAIVHFIQSLLAGEYGGYSTNVDVVLQQVFQPNQKPMPSEQASREDHLPAMLQLCFVHDPYSQRDAHPTKKQKFTPVVEVGAVTYQFRLTKKPPCAHHSTYAPAVTTYPTQEKLQPAR